MKLLKEITDKDILGTDGLSDAKPRITARAILKNQDGQYAVMYSEDFDFYSFPGGGIEEGEDVISALKREIMEETGCACDVIEELGVVRENRAHCDYTQISYYFIVTTNDTLLNPALTEAEKTHKTIVNWYTLEEAVRLITEPVYDKVQRKFLQARDKAALEGYMQIIQSCSAIEHYDLLIDENNDSVRDSRPLQDYMDKWDGQSFIEKMELSENACVLEIGVGTGRLAVRTAPLCAQFCGVDISPKTIERAKENLSKYENVALLCCDFLTYDFEQKYDVIYSSLTLMHIKDKKMAVSKAASLLKNGGRFVLSIDKNQDKFIDMGTRRVTVFPDTPEEIENCISTSGLTLVQRYEAEAAFIFVAVKSHC